jgi:hypothetical protein
MAVDRFHVQTTPEGGVEQKRQVIQVTEKPQDDGGGIVKEKAVATKAVVAPTGEKVAEAAKTTVTQDKVDDKGDIVAQEEKVEEAVKTA